MKQILIIAVLFSVCNAKAQPAENVLKNPGIRGRVYLETGLGVSLSSYRDFAESPLTYRGILADVPLNLSFFNARREMNFLINNSLGGYTIPEDGGQISSTGYKLNLRFSYLRLLKNWSNEKWQYHTGGAYDLTTIVRINPALFNAALGTNVLGSLFGSFKVTRNVFEGRPLSDLMGSFFSDFSRPRIFLSYRIDFSLLNSSVQRSFPYLGQEVLLNNYIFFDNYEVRLFSGFRIASRFEFTYFLKNRNAISLSYNWDACKTGSDLPIFEFAQHTLQLSFWYNFI